MNPKAKSARASVNWIGPALAHSTPGALHRELGIKPSKKIPVARLDVAAASQNPLLQKRARLALTLRKFH